MKNSPHSGFSWGIGGTFLSARERGACYPAHTDMKAGIMEQQVFVIKSLYVQNTIMVLSMGVVLFFLLRSLWKKKKRHALVFSVWVFVVLWFFNSSLFGFSRVRLSPEGIHLDYGILSFRDCVLPLDTTWALKSCRSGIRKNKTLYYLMVGGRESMRVRLVSGVRVLEDIGDTIDLIKKAT